MASPSYLTPVFLLPFPCSPYLIQYFKGRQSVLAVIIQYIPRSRTAAPAVAYYFNPSAKLGSGYGKFTEYCDVIIPRVRVHETAGERVQCGPLYKVLQIYVH